MKEYSVKIPIGIGDLVYIKGLLDLTKDRFSCINISPNMALFNGRPKYKPFVMELMGMLFKPPFYNITMDQSYPFKSIVDMWRQLKIKPRKPNVASILCEGELPKGLHSGKYIVINTKVRALKKNAYRAFQPKLFKLLRSIGKHKIVLLGEREIEFTNEYKNLGHKNIYCIYRDLVDYLPSNKIVDLTISKLGITPPNMKKFKHDCNIMHHAHRVIQIGGGGSFCVSSAISKLICIISYSSLPFFAEVFRYNEYKDVLVANNSREFLKAIEEIS